MSNYSRRLTVTHIRKIRSAYWQRGVSQAELAQQYGVSRSWISLIVRRKAWYDVPPITGEPFAPGRSTPI